MRYDVCNMLEFIRDCRPLFQEHWDESGQKGQTFKLNYGFYERLSDRDAYAIVARDGDRVAGYVSVFLSAGTHTSTIVAFNDGIYIRPEYRRGVLGGRLFYLAEAEAKERGAKHFQWACNLGSPLHYVLARRPHGMVQIVYEREL